MVSQSFYDVKLSCTTRHVTETAALSNLASADMRYTPEDDSLRKSDTIRVIRKDRRKPNRQPGDPAMSLERTEED